MNKRFSLKFKNKKVNVYNKRATIVKMTACMPFEHLFYYMDIAGMKGWWKLCDTLSSKYGDIITFEETGKALLSSDDVYDKNYGEKLAECRARIKTIKRALTFLNKIMSFFSKLLFGENKHSTYVFHNSTTGVSASIYTLRLMLKQEQEYLDKLLSNERGSH